MSTWINLLQTHLPSEDFWKSSSFFLSKPASSLLVTSTIVYLEEILGALLSTDFLYILCKATDKVAEIPLTRA